MGITKDENSTSIFRMIFNTNGLKKMIIVGEPHIDRK